MAVKLFNWERKRQFLGVLRQCGNVTASCAAAGVSLPTVYKHRDQDKRFRRGWDAALEHAYDTLEQEAWRRAVYGVAEPIYYKGDKVGAKQVYSDTLMKTLLEGNRPQKFRRSELALTGSGNAGELVINIGSPPKDAEPEPDPEDLPEPLEAEEEFQLPATLRADPPVETDDWGPVDRAIPEHHSEDDSEPWPEEWV